MMRYLNAYHHNSRHAGEYSFNEPPLLLHNSRRHADVSAAIEQTIEPYTRRVGVWRIKAKI
jgi:hypothetical protein